MKIIDPKKYPKLKNVSIEAKKIYNKEFGEIVHITLKPKEKIPLHSVGVDVVFYIIDSGLTFITPRKKEKLTADKFIFSKKGNYHGIENNTRKNCRFIVIKLPKQTLPTKYKK